MNAQANAQNTPHVTENPIKLRGGNTIPPGCGVTWCNGKATVHTRERPVRVSARAAARALGIEFPTMEDLARWTYDSGCDSILGHWVEPDGIDPEGSPSWLLALDFV